MRSPKTGSNSPSVRAQWLDRVLVVSPYHIGLCTDAGAFERELKRMKIPKADRPGFIANGAGATVHFFEASDGMLSAVVCITRPKGVTRHALNGLLVHEAMHIWRRIRQWLGESKPSAEFEAYAIQHISQQLMEAFWNEPTKGKKP